MVECVYWIWLQQVFGCGSHRSNVLTERFPTAREIYEMGADARKSCRCFTETELEKMEQIPLSAAEAVYARCGKLGIRVLTPHHSEFPERLWNIYAMPMVLYVKGSLAGIDGRIAITMVGTRKATDYGEEMARLLAGGLARYGVTVVSGLAEGIDISCVDEAAKNRGKIISVLANGLDVYYPKEHQGVQDWLGENNAIVSEYPPGVRPGKGNFHPRNRLLSGLGMGTVVVEAPLRSGALITANHALDQGKDVFAVPGRVTDPSFQGALRLIQQGARAATCPEDILDEYESVCHDKLREESWERIRTAIEEKCAWKPRVKPTAKKKESGGQQEPKPEKAPAPERLTELQKRVYDEVGFDAVPAETLAGKVGLKTYELLPLLTELEIEGLIRSGAGGFRLP